MERNPFICRQHVEAMPTQYRTYQSEVVIDLSLVPPTRSFVLVE